MARHVRFRSSQHSEDRPIQRAEKNSTRGYTREYRCTPGKNMVSEALAYIREAGLRPRRSPRVNVPGPGRVCLSPIKDRTDHLRTGFEAITRRPERSLARTGGRTESYAWYKGGRVSDDPLPQSRGRVQPTLQGWHPGSKVPLPEMAITTIALPGDTVVDCRLGRCFY